MDELFKIYSKFTFANELKWIATVAQTRPANVPRVLLLRMHLLRRMESSMRMMDR